MEYIIMRHANDLGFNDTYCKIRDSASKGVTLSREDIADKMASLEIDSNSNLARTAGGISQRVTGQPLTVAYNDALRTEVTARAIARITGGNLVAGELQKGNEVYQWMQYHAGEDGLSVIVTHEPAIQGLLNIHKEVKHASAYFIGNVKNVGGGTFQQI